MSNQKRRVPVWVTTPLYFMAVVLGCLLFGHIGGYISGKHKIDRCLETSSTCAWWEVNHNSSIFLSNELKGRAAQAAFDIWTTQGFERDRVVILEHNTWSDEVRQLLLDWPALNTPDNQDILVVMEAYDRSPNWEEALSMIGMIYDDELRESSRQEFMDLAYMKIAIQGTQEKNQWFLDKYPPKDHVKNIPVFIYQLREKLGGLYGKNYVYGSSMAEATFYHMVGQSEDDVQESLVNVFLAACDDQDTVSSFRSIFERAEKRGFPAEFRARVVYELHLVEKNKAIAYYAKTTGNEEAFNAAVLSMAKGDPVMKSVYVVDQENNIVREVRGLSLDFL